MAVTTKTELWKLAAAMMGMNPAQHVLNADAPSTVLETSFNTLYDQIRVAEIRSGKFNFAKRTQALRAAPTLDYRGKRHTWTDQWSYTYAPPVDALLFLGFTQDKPDRGLLHDFEMVKLPISYAEIAATVVASYIVEATNSAEYLPNYVWREWCRARIIDNNNVEHFVVDYADGSTVNTFDWKDEKTGIELPGHASQSYVGGVVWSVDVQPAVVAGTYALSAAPTLLMEVAYGSPYLDEPQVRWDDHIATDLVAAEARYIVDVTSPAMWPVEFQNLVAARLAYQASIIHAKSPRIVQLLERQAAMAQSHAISSLSAADGFVTGGGPSLATRARRS